MAQCGEADVGVVESGGDDIVGVVEGKRRVVVGVGGVQWGVGECTRGSEDGGGIVCVVCVTLTVEECCWWWLWLVACGRIRAVG